MDKGRNRKLMQRLARQMKQAAQTAVTYHEENPHTDLKLSVNAATERAARRFARREIRPILHKKKLKQDNDRLYEAMNQRTKGNGCFDTRGNKIKCPVDFRSYEAIMSVKRAIFDDFGRYVRDESSNPIFGSMSNLQNIGSISNIENKGFWDLGLEGSLVGDGFKFRDHYTYNKDFWLGKNGKFYSDNWGGNAVAGGKLKYARRLGKLLSGISTSLGIYSVISTLQDDTISEEKKIVDTVVNGIGFAGVPGAAFNLGFNLGYVIEDACNCNIQLNPRYFNAKYIKRNGWRFDKFFEDPKQPYRSVFDR